MKKMEDLKESIHKNKDTIVIIGSKAGNDLLSQLSDEEKNKVSKFHTNKTFRRRSKKYWQEYDNVFKPLLDEKMTPGNKVYELLKSLIDKGLIKRIYYQDIDGQIPEDENHIHIKGSINKFVCSNKKCLEKYNINNITEDKKCSKCESDIRPTFIFIEDNYDFNVEKTFVDDLNETHNIITIGLDLSEEYIVGLIDAFDQKRNQEENGMKNKNIVAIHNEDEDLNYNDFFLCDFQALGDLEDSTSRLIKAIL